MTLFDSDRTNDINCWLIRSVNNTKILYLTNNVTNYMEFYSTYIYAINCA